MKLILGVANSSSKYSLNQLKKNSYKNFFKILDFAKKNNIKIIDTAPKYNKAENVLGHSNFNNFKIITKLSNVNKKEIRNNLLNQILNSKKKLKVNKIYGLLIHDINFFKKKNSKIISKTLLEIKQKGLVSKIGFSVYDPDDIDFILKFIKPDIIQLPFSLFDKRFLLTNKIKKLNSLGVKVHVRSIFLRGLLFTNYDQIPKQLQIFIPALKKLNYWCEKNKITKLKSTINYIKNFKNIDAVVIGVDSVDQLREIIYAFNNSSKKFPKKIRFEIPNKYLDIRKWKI